MRRSFFCCFLLIICVVQGLLVDVYAAEDANPSQPNVLFLIGPEDELEISAWKDESLTKNVVIRPDGKFSFPLIGEVMAGGRTVDELSQEVEKRVRSYVPDARVTVMLTKVSSPKVYIVGKVDNPGVYLMGRPITVMQALSMAGGLTTFADKNDILIIRTGDDGQKVFKFDYSKVSKGKELEQNIQLEPADTLVIP
ncbi:MAG: polysaccharide export protein [Desulfobacteraceae bacterium]|nr:polysaccharide biosynthesis/export family protein [Desulfobacteraceae bacterium]MBC2753939.1 polysaccharide export protein [Desulfobacteraceae bacterium]